MLHGYSAHHLTALAVILPASLNENIAVKMILEDFGLLDGKLHVKVP
jgi:hypothetical protein